MRNNSVLILVSVRGNRYIACKIRKEFKSKNQFGAGAYIGMSELLGIFYWWLTESEDKWFFIDGSLSSPGLLMKASGAHVGLQTACAGMNGARLGRKTSLKTSPVSRDLCISCEYGGEWPSLRGLLSVLTLLWHKCSTFDADRVGWSDGSHWKSYVHREGPAPPRRETVRSPVKQRWRFFANENKWRAMWLLVTIIETRCLSCARHKPQP